MPLEERGKVIVVLNKEPISWNVVYQEIKNNTKRSQKILKELEII